VTTKEDNDTYVDPEVWLAETPMKQGSWWPEWTRWLDARSADPVAPPPLGVPGGEYAPVCDAPGTYVRMR
jgi:polyhydroxyalkanoate synthase